MKIAGYHDALRTSALEQNVLAFRMKRTETMEQ